VTKREWLRRLLSSPSPSPNSTCPICDEPIITARNVYPPESFPRTREERIACCATHGHPPLNAATVKWAESKGK
jgi:hypothetical protein